MDYVVGNISNNISFKLVALSCMVWGFCYLIQKFRWGGFKI